MKENDLNVRDEFELDPFVMAIQPVFYGSRIYSKIIKTKEEFIAPYRPLDIIKKSCRIYASSFTGRKEGTKELISVSTKPPLVIDPIQSIYVFPTVSPTKHQDCCWISDEHVMTYNSVEGAKTAIIFNNKKKLIVDMSKSSFEKQMNRTARLRTKMLQNMRQQELKRQYLKRQLDLSLEAMEKHSIYDVFPDVEFGNPRGYLNRPNK